ncbi:hypothetical protein L0F63_001855 [Massospora cicadina]|nr:hypothetical protein L0F63_001855 [Massospora cicadina]
MGSLMTRKLAFEEFCNLSSASWGLYAQAYHENPYDSLLAQMAREYIDDNRLFSPESRPLWLNLMASSVPELLAYLALVAHTRGPVYVGWVLDAMEASLAARGEGPPAELAAGHIATALQYFLVPQRHCAQLLPLFAHPPPEPALVKDLKVAWLEIYRQITANPSDYSQLYGLINGPQADLASNKRAAAQPAATAVAKRRALPEGLSLINITPDYFRMPRPQRLTPEWVHLCHRGLALWQDAAARLTPGMFRHMIGQVVDEHYPANRMVVLDCVLGLWMLILPERAAWAVEPLVESLMALPVEVGEGATPAGLLLQLFDGKAFTGGGLFGCLLAQRYSASQMEAMALRWVLQAFALIMSRPQDRLQTHRSFLKLSLERISPAALEGLARWGVERLDSFAQCGLDLDRVCYGNVADHVPAAVMLRQLLLLRPDAPNAVAIRLEMISRLQDITLLLWGCRGGYHEPCSAGPHPACLDFLVGVLRLMVATPPASLVPLHKWTNHHLIPTILANHSLNPAYGLALLVALLRDVALFDALMGGYHLKATDLAGYLDLIGISVSPHPGLKAFLELLSSELDSLAQFTLACQWVTMWEENSLVCWRWKMALATCYPLCSLAKNVTVGFLESIPPAAEAYPWIQTDLCTLLRFSLVSEGCDAMLPLVCRALQRLSPSPVNCALVCIEEVVLSLYLVLGAPALGPGVLPAALEALLAVMKLCTCLTEGQLEAFADGSLQEQLELQLIASPTLHQTLLSTLVLAWHGLANGGPLGVLPSQRVRQLFIASCKLHACVLGRLLRLGRISSALKPLYKLPVSAHHPVPPSQPISDPPDPSLVYAADLSASLALLRDSLGRAFPQSPLVALFQLHPEH